MGWETVDRVLIVEVWPLRKSELDRPFGDRTADERRYLSRLDDLSMMMEGEADEEYLRILTLILARLFVS